MVVRIMSDAGSDDLDEERVQDLGVRMYCLNWYFFSLFFGCLTAYTHTINLQHWLTVSNDLGNLHIYMIYYNITNQPVLSSLLPKTCYLEMHR